MEGFRVVYAFLAGIICIKLCKCGKLENIPSQNSKYESFKVCLAMKNFTNIIPRGNSKDFKLLNYQWQLKPPYKTPLAYVLVKNEQDVMAAVRCGTRHKIRVVPKGGGHSLEKFGLGDEDSVVVDVRKLETLEINMDDMTATVGAGWLVGPLAYTLWKKENVFTALGICPTVGISGIATGGGCGSFSRMHGLTVDVILEVKIVTADSTLVTANKNKHADLYWALRGGVGSNFGIITQFVLKIYSAPANIFYGTLTYGTSQFAEAFKAWQQHIPTAPDALTAYFTIFNGKIEIHFIDVTGTTTHFESLAKKFPENGNKTGTSYPFIDRTFQIAKYFEYFTPETKFNSAADFMNLDRKSQLPLYHKRRAFFVSRKIGAKEIDVLKAFVEGIPEALELVFESYGGAINKVLANETAFVHRGNLYNAFAQFRFPYPNVTAVAIHTLWVQKFFDLGKLLFFHRESYQNYVDIDLPDYLQRYYGSNLQRLIQVKKKFDAGNYFYNPQSIPTRI